VHVDQVREHGGLLGVRDENVLESALARARQRWSYEPEADLPRLAADYAFGICRSHPFRDGNKRAAFLTAVIFLGLNGLDFVAPEDEVVEKMLALAAGELGEEEIAMWFRSHTRPRTD
jgi:death-on-curing protein